MRLGIDASNIRAGGGLTHLREVLKAAQPHEHGITEVTVWACKKTLEQMPSRVWLRAVDEPTLNGSLPSRLRWRRTRLPRLAQQACDLLFVPGGTYEKTFRPYVMFSQNLLPFDGHEWRRYGWSWTTVRLGLLRFGQGKGFRNADGVIFLTKNSRAVISRKIGRFRGPSITIPYGVDAGFRLAPRAQESIDKYSEDKPFKFLYVSTVDLYKHQWHVAEAVAELRRTGLPVALDLIGAAYQPALRRLENVSARLDPRGDFIRYHGLVPYSQLAEIYQQTDAFVFASTCESLPNILLEAMAAGLPIACSNREPMPEVLANTGIYFDPEDPGSIAKALHTLAMSTELRAQYAAAAFERAKDYSWERCASETFSFLAQIGQDLMEKKS
jgi:glycosyltransferase involved in cell wall biosynthesis